MTPDKQKLLQQAMFCKELTDRLKSDVERSEIRYGVVDKYTVMQNDIIRLRRELHKLSNMLDPWRQEAE